MEKQIHQCSECNKTFTERCNLRKHARIYHPGKETVIVPSKTFKYSCDHCNRHFNDERNFTHHKKRHDTNFNPKLNVKNCPLCPFAGLYKQLLTHFEEKHNKELKYHNLKFESLDQFHTWKKKVENETKSQFIKIRGSTRIGDTTKISFHCHRTGNFISRSAGLRRLKAQGSKKINGYCPAFMRVAHRKNDENCEVQFLETHIGHDNDLEHMMLSKEERESIAEKMCSKVPFTRILEDVQDSVNTSQLERIHLLKRKDLHNIKNSFRLKSVQYRDDATNVEEWVAQKENSGCVLFYKGQNTESEEHPELDKDDFLLVIMNVGQEDFLKKYSTNCVCLDKIPGLDENDYELHTLLVLDDRREAFPCAFFISNRTDREVIHLFLRHVRDKIGENINCDVFMSLTDDLYHEAWVEVMGPTNCRLFCTWHVEQDWQKQFPLIETKDKQVMVYSYLKSLVQEKDVAVFEPMFQNFVDTVTSDSATVDFANYFVENYSENVESWAHCFRENDANTELENMHRSLKFIYLDGQRIKRLDKAVNEMLKLVRTKMFNKVVLKKESENQQQIEENLLTIEETVMEEGDENAEDEYLESEEVFRKEREELRETCNSLIDSLTDRGQLEVLRKVINPLIPALSFFSCKNTEKIKIIYKDYV